MDLPFIGYRINERWFDDEHERLNPPPTHWMPLPDPPVALTRDEAKRA
jgi:hypothetical protein